MTRRKQGDAVPTTEQVLSPPISGEVVAKLAERQARLREEDERPLIVERVPPQQRPPELHRTLDPCFQNAMAMRLLEPELVCFTDSKGTDDIRVIAAQLHGLVKRLQSGDESTIDAVLMGQAYTLQVLFATMLERAFATDDPVTMNDRLRIALRAQNQSRVTLEGLAMIRRGRRPIVIQQNNVAGVQQVNNCPTGTVPVGETIPANELLESLPNERMDPGETRQPVSVDTRVEAVAKGRRKDCRGQDGKPDERPKARTTQRRYASARQNHS